jgi:hypothetical protein
MNERVTWIAPPYRSEAQQVFLQNTKERAKAGRYTRWPDKADRERLHAGGFTDQKTDLVRKQMRAAGRLHAKAMKAGTAAFAWSMPFWCIWGFKPGRGC